ncbi:MAG: winged helix DNA-binding domain-containing protein [Gordonia paraffinivorans]
MTTPQPPRRTLSPATTRRIALGAQGFADRPPTGDVTRRHLRRVVDRLGVIQMDSVNVAVRAHYMPLFSRLGPYTTSVLDDAAWRSTATRRRLLTEYWAHEAALIDVDDWPLFGWRMADYRFGRYSRATSESSTQTRLRAEVLAAVTDLGPSTGGMLEDALGRRREGPRRGSWWDRSEVKHTCEVMLAAGELAAVRDDTFARHYDLAERVVGEERVGRHIPRDEAVDTLMRRAAGALGVATELDLRDYFRLPVVDARASLARLVENGDLTPVAVRGWDATAYLDPTARAPRRVTASALLAPFDPLVFFRPRLARLFGMDYRIEIYVPKPKRVYGYYVFPYLWDETVGARVDLKHDRTAGVLRVQSAHAEDDVDRGALSESLAADLRTMAGWLGADDVVVADRGDLAPDLTRALK